MTLELAYARLLLLRVALLGWGEGWEVIWAISDMVVVRRLPSVARVLTFVFSKMILSIAALALSAVSKSLRCNTAEEVDSHKCKDSENACAS